MLVVWLRAGRAQHGGTEGRSGLCAGGKGPSSAVFQCAHLIRIQATSASCWKACLHVFREPCCSALTCPNTCLLTRGIPLAQRLRGLSNPPIWKDTHLKKAAKLGPSCSKHVYCPEEQREALAAPTAEADGSLNRGCVPLSASPPAHHGAACWPEGLHDYS